MASYKRDIFGPRSTLASTCDRTAGTAESEYGPSSGSPSDPVSGIAFRLPGAAREIRRALGDESRPQEAS